MHQCARETKHCPSQTAHALHPVIIVFSMLPSHLYTWRGTCQNAFYFFMQIIPLPEMPWLNPEARDSVRIPFCVCVCLQTQRAQHHSPSTTNTSHPSWENGPHQHDYKCREMHATPANPFSHAAPIHSNINLKALLLLRCHILFNVQLCEVSEQAGHAKWSSPSECMGVCNTLAAGSFKLFLLIRENK